MSMNLTHWNDLIKYLVHIQAVFCKLENLKIYIGKRIDYN